MAAATAEAAGITTTSSTPNVNEVVHTIPAHILNPPQPYSKININQPVDNEGNSILHWACSMANINMIEFLLEIFKDYLSSTIKNHHGETPLMFATRFSNSFQLKNFSTLLDLLFDSILLIDNAGRTILHHIAISATVHERNGSSGSFVGDQGSQQYATYKKNKEKFARYYMETLFAKIIELQDYQENGHNKKSEHIKIQNNLVPTGAIKNELIAKVINHQDINGNTAFHIIAYNLNKKLIKVFIGYHKYIDFTLKNLVSYTVEEYLASHNFVLRLGNDIISQTVPEAGNSINRIKDSFENELFVSRNALNSFKSSTGALNEKFLELSYCIDKELSAKDGKLLLYYKVVKQAKLEKLYSQSDILKFFKLDHLIEDQINEVTKRPDEIEDEDETEEKRDNIIQDEIYRLVSDLSYEYLKKKEELNNKVLIYKKVSDVLVRKKLKELEKRFIGESEINNSAVDGDSNERFRLSIALQQNIIKRQNLMKRLIIEQLKVPISVNDKENVFDSTRNPTEPSSTPTMKSEATPLSTPRTTSLSTTTTTSSQSSILSRYPRDDKLNKYCKLISICCGMNFNDIEKLIDLIDQSLSDQQSLASATQPAAN